jgi:NAD(P)-dependent dehydrogenase (short-subunit alcohol dehydrogenase family)
MAKTLSVDLTGKVALVTGANAGIGKEVARGLLERGAHVIFAVRSVEKGQEAARELGGKSTVLQVDMSSPASIRAFAAQVTAQFPKLHMLVNNAGAWFSDRRTSPEGRELTFATNVLGVHVLSEALTPLLKASAPSRIVNVVSAFTGSYDAGDLEFDRRGYDGFKAYQASKQAARMLTWGLSKRLEGSGVTVNAAAPGFVKTGFNRNAKGFVATMINFSAALFADSPKKAAYAVLYVAAAPELEGVTGRYYDRAKEKEGSFREEGPIADLERQCAQMANDKQPGSGPGARSAWVAGSAADGKPSASGPIP